MFLLCFCFKNFDRLDRQTAPFDFILSTLFVIFTSGGLKFWVLSLHPKQYIVPSSFPVFIAFIFDRVFFMSYIVGSIFCTIHFKHFDFIEWFDLNSNPSNLFKRSWISDFLVDFWCVCVSCLFLWKCWIFSIRGNSNKHTSKFFF